MGTARKCCSTIQESRQTGEKGYLAKAARHADSAQIKTDRAEHHASQAERQKAEAFKDEHAEADGDDTI